MIYSKGHRKGQHIIVIPRGQEDTNGECYGNQDDSGYTSEGRHGDQDWNGDGHGDGAGVRTANEQK